MYTPTPQYQSNHQGWYPEERLHEEPGARSDQGDRGVYETRQP